MQPRPLYLQFIQDIAFKHGKMAFITGPRQVGKTTLAQELLQKGAEGRYYSWDDLEFKRSWVKDPKKMIPEKIGVRQTIIFDELHKAPRWKSTLKGVYDLCHRFADIVVTGSAKLDIFRRGGESLFGRYYLLRMHPFTLGELVGTSANPDDLLKALQQCIPEQPGHFENLLRFGGFPEPLLNKDEAIWNLWRRSRLEKLIKGELLSLTQSHELALIETCAALLQERVGSPFSIQSLAEILDVSHPTVRRWLGWISQLFYFYAISPYSKRLSRSFKKQPKIYLADWSEVEDSSARFENMVAAHLLKACHYWTDVGKGLFELCYLRDKEKREVDFLITHDRNPWILAECKENDVNISPHLFYFERRLNAPMVLQIVKKSGIQEKFDVSKDKKGILISADRFLTLF